MAIQIYCTSCYTSNGLDAKSCSNCGATFGRDKKYRVCVSIKGKRVTRVVDNLTIARETEGAIKGDMLRGEFDIYRNVKQVPTVGEVWKAYLKWARIPGNKKTWITDKFNYETHLEPRFANKHLNKISAIDVNRLKLSMTRGKTNDGKPYLSKRGKPFSAATIKHQLVLLHRLYKFAQGPDFKYKGETPFDHGQVKMPHLDNQRTTYFSDEQLAALRSTLETWPNRTQAAFIQFALLTGVRRGTLFPLRWADLDFARNMVTLVISHRRKGTETVTTRVTPEAMEVLKALPRTSDYVFPGKNGEMRSNFKGPWLRIKKAAGLPDDFRFHDLRHNFASTHVNKGGRNGEGENLKVVQELLNHKDFRTTLKYAHLGPGRANEAAVRSGELLTPKQKLEKVSERSD